jgi:hypothetical protein
MMQDSRYMIHHCIGQIKFFLYPASYIFHLEFCILYLIPYFSIR